MACGAETATAGQVTKQAWAPLTTTARLLRAAPMPAHTRARDAHLRTRTPTHLVQVRCSRVAPVCGRRPSFLNFWTFGGIDPPSSSGSKSAVLSLT